MDLQQNPNNGQVLRNTEMGELLFNLTSFPQYKTFLEIGTWKGNGTTRCIVDGLLNRVEKGDTDIHFWSIEANKEFYTIARELWEPKGLPFLHLLYGKLHTQGLMSAQEIETHLYFPNIVTHYQLWYGQDVIDYGRSPYIRPELFPPRIDVVLLDGGEFCGYADWLALKDKKPKVVILDDTNVMKNERVYKELKSDSNYTMRIDRNERHGWAVFERCMND